jgi:hypothetical protein
MDDKGVPIIGTIGEVSLEPSIEKTIQLPQIKDPDADKF